MVEIDDIDSREALETWLKDKPHDWSVTIAARAAMRVLPIWWDSIVKSTVAMERDLIALTALRCLFVSSATVKFAIEDLMTAVDFLVTDAAYFAGSATVSRDASDAGISSAYAAALYTGRFEACAATSQATRAYRAYAYAHAGDADRGSVTSAAAYTAWHLVRADCSALVADEKVMDHPLWGTERNPLAKMWAGVKKRAPEESWAFWRAWYDAALKGNPLPDALLLKIARIDPEDWGKGPAHVNPIINEMWRGFAKSEGSDDTPEGQASLEPFERALERNAKVVQQQLHALVAFVEEEMHRLKSRNDISDEERERLAQRVDILSRIKQNVERLIEALEDPEVDASRALVVLGETLPAVADEVDKLDDDEEAAQASAAIKAMALSVQTLTEAGTPGTVAAGIAAADLAWGKLSGFWKKGRG